MYDDLSKKQEMWAEEDRKIFHSMSLAMCPEGCIWVEDDKMQTEEANPPGVLTLEALMFATAVIETPSGCITAFDEKEETVDTIARQDILLMINQVDLMNYKAKGVIVGTDEQDE